MASKTLQKQRELERRERQIRRLYALVWLLACPLAFILARLCGFAQVNVVYWTLLVVPVLLGVYNVRQVPPVRGKPAVPASEEETDPDDRPEPDEEEAAGVTRLQHTRMLAQALTLPVVIALPILLTVVVDLCIRFSSAA